jgi:tetratricopeptide (TPR) repeat protein
MLFLTIPLGLALGSLVVITVVVWRKMPYLRKLTPESHEVGETVLHDFAPELIAWIHSIPWRQYVHNVLVEFEKALRRGRLLMSSLDRVSDRVIRRVRRVHEETARQHEQIVTERKEEAARQEEEPDEIDMEDPDQLRQEEQRLIVAIAQHPKDVDLYSRLARVYMRLQNFTDAVEALTAASKLAPDDELLKTRLDRARQRKEKADKDATAAVAAGQ